MKGQGSVISLAILVLAAVVLGSAFVVYFTSAANVYRSRAAIENAVARDSLNTIVTTLASWVNQSTGHSYAFVMVHRLDNSPATILVIPYVAQGYYVNRTVTNGIVVKVLNPAGDTDGVFCDEETDCIPLNATILPGSRVLINPVGRGWMPFSALYGVSSVKAFVLHYAGGSQIILVDVPSASVNTVYLALGTNIGSYVYIYEVVPIAFR